MSSHILAEVARLAARIGSINKGYLLQELDAEGLERHRHRRLLVRARDQEAALRALAAAGQPAALLPDGTLELTDAAAIGRPDDVAGRLAAAGVPPTHLVVEEEELEHSFLRLVGFSGGAA